MSKPAPYFNQNLTQMQGSDRRTHNYFVPPNGGFGINDGIVKHPHDKELISLVDITDRKRADDPTGELLIFQFSDGTVEKKFIR